MLMGAFLGGYLGHVIGEARSFGYKLQAQSALCQVEVQRNTAASVRAALVGIEAVAPVPANGATTKAAV